MPAPTALHRECLLCHAQQQRDVSAADSALYTLLTVRVTGLGAAIESLCRVHRREVDEATLEMQAAR